MIEILWCFITFVFFFCFVMGTIYLSGIRSDTAKIIRYLDIMNRKMK